MFSIQSCSILRKLSFSVETLTFDYSELESETPISIQQNTRGVIRLIHHTFQYIIYIGQKLRVVKQQLEHGRFQKWIKVEFKLSVSALTKFIQISQQFK